MALCSTPNCSQNRESASHCIEHHIRFNKVYLRYKELHSRLTTPDVSRLSLVDIKLLYQQYYRVYKLRVWYMNHAFREELRDKGHVQMAENLYTYMNTLVRKMENITKDYKEEVVEKRESSDDSESEESIVEEVQPISVLLKRHKKINEILTDTRLKCLNKAVDADLRERKRLLGFFANRIIQPALNTVTVKKNAINENVMTNVLNRHESMSSAASIKIFEIFLRIIMDIYRGSMSRINVLPIFRSVDIIIPPGCCIKQAVLILSNEPDICKYMVMLGVQLLAFGLDIVVYFENHKDRCVVKYRTQGKSSDVGTCDTAEEIDNMKRIATLFTIHKKDLLHTHVHTAPQCNYCKEEIDKELDYGILHPKT